MKYDSIQNVINEDEYDEGMKMNHWKIIIWKNSYFN